MTQAFAAQTTINAPVDDVWQRLVDWETAPRWMPGVDALRAQGPTAMGTTLVFTTRGKERTGRIAALEPGRTITLRSTQGGVTADYVYTCARQDRSERTQVRLQADCRMTGWVRLLGPVIRSAIRRADRGQLDAFAATFAAG